MAFGFGLPGLTSANPDEDAALSPAMLALLRAQQPGARGPLASGLIPETSPSAGLGGQSASSARVPFGFVPPVQQASGDQDAPTAIPSGLSQSAPTPTSSPTRTGSAAPFSMAGLPSIGSVLRGMSAGATETGDTVTDLGSRIGSALGDMVGRSKDLIGRMQSGEISPGQFLSGAVSHARDAAMAGPNFTRNFLDGKIDPGSEEAVGGAFGAAATAMTGSLPFKVPAGALRTFGGRAAATADHAALDRAAGMQAAGASPDAIWQGTGWGLGRDGAARFEIPDNAASLRPHDGSKTTLLGTVLDHPPLFDAYPQLRDVSVFHRPELGSNAAANPSRNWIAANLDDPQALPSLLHESQHLIQRAEGFAPGASPIDPALAAHPQVAEAAALRQRLAGLDAPQAVALADRTDHAARMNAYRTAAGEVEARNVEARQGMTPAERSATPPWATQDVPSDRQWLPMGRPGAVTGDAAQLKLGAAPQSDPLAALEASLAGLKPETPTGPRLLDPNAKSWDLYHGSTAGPDFPRFDPTKGSNPAEQAVFLAPSAETASGYAGPVVRSGTEAGPRVFRTTVDPGKTEVFDLGHLVENDPSFNARARALTVRHEGATWGPVFDDAMSDFARNRAEHRSLSAQAEAMGYPASAPDGVPFGYGHIGAAVQMAKEKGLDTAIIRGLGEHGGDDQVIALTPGRVRSAYAPDQLLYGAAGVGTVAASGIGGATDAQASPTQQGQGQPRGALADRIVGAESGGKATAKNPDSSATGAGQFISGTWLDMMKRYRPDLAGSLPKDQLLALRNDPALSREMVNHYAEENGAKLRAAGLPDTDGTRYLSHFAGSKGAKAILSANPSTPAAQVLDPAQVAANPFVRKMTAGQLTDWAAQKVGGSAPTMRMPGAAAGPATFGIGGPTQFRVPTAPTAPVTPVAGGKDFDALLAALPKSQGAGGGLGLASGSSVPEGGGAPILSAPAPQRRPFGFMTFAGQTPPKSAHQKPPTRRTTR